MLGLRTAFGGGQGPNVMKQVVIILGIWVVIKYRAPPPSPDCQGLYARPRMNSKSFI